MIAPRPRYPAPFPGGPAAPTVYRVTLPWPPGVNHLFGTNFKTKRRFVTETYETWKRQAADCLATRHPATTLPAGPLAVHFRFHPPKGRRAWDVDGRFKAPLDALVAHFAPDLDDSAARIAVVEGEAMPYDGEEACVRVALETFAAWRARTDRRAIWEREASR